MSNNDFIKKLQQHHKKFSDKLAKSGDIQIKPKYVKIIEKKANSVSEFRDEVLRLRKELDKKAIQNLELNKKTNALRDIKENLQNVEAKITEYENDLKNAIEEEYKAHINSVLGDLQEKLDRIDSRIYLQFKDKKRSLTNRIEKLYNIIE